MSTPIFIYEAKKAIVNYYIKHNKDNGNGLSIGDVYVVWYCKTLQNIKALFGTPIDDGMYYECTFDGIENRMYINAYKIIDQEIINF